MIDPKRTTRIREEHSRDELYQQAKKLYRLVDLCLMIDDTESADALRADADFVYRRAEALEEAIASGYYGK